MCLQQPISAFPKQGGAVDAQYRRGLWAAVFYDQGLLLYRLPAGRSFPRLGAWVGAGGSSKSCSTDESPMGWCAAPSPLWDGHDWMLLSPTLFGETLLRQGQPQLGPSLVAGLCFPDSSFYPGFDVCHTGWSLFICLLGFPCCVPLRSVPMLRRSQPHTRSAPFPTLLSHRTLLLSGLFPPSPV